MTAEAGDCCARVRPAVTGAGRLYCASCGEQLEAVWQGEDGELHSSEAGAGAFELAPR